MVIDSITSIIQAVVDYHKGNFTPTTILWTLFGIIGAVITVFNMNDAQKDSNAVLLRTDPDMDDVKREGLLLVARNAIRRELIRLSAMLTVIAIGVAVALSSPVITDAERKALHIPYWTPTGIALTLALFWIIGSMLVNAILDRRERKFFYNRRNGR